jgi:hypothetical protein
LFARANFKRRLSSRAGAIARLMRIPYTVCKEPLTRRAPVCRVPRKLSCSNAHGWGGTCLRYNSRLRCQAVRLSAFLPEPLTERHRSLLFALILGPHLHSDVAFRRRPLSSTFELGRSARHPATAATDSYPSKLESHSCQAAERKTKPHTRCARDHRQTDQLVQSD